MTEERRGAPGPGASDEDGGGKPLPRRVPGAADSPRPPDRVASPTLPESVRQRLLTALAQEGAAAQELATAEPAAEQPVAQPAAREAIVPPPRAAPPQRPVSPPQHPSAANGGPVRSPESSAAPSATPRLAAPPEAPTEPFSRISEPVADATPSLRPAWMPTVGENGTARPAEAGAEGLGTTERAAPVRGRPAAAQRDPGRRSRRGRGYRLIGALVSVVILIAVGALALALHGRPATAHRGGASPRERAAGAATRGLAATWVAGQVNRTAIVSCGPAMCQLLKARGFPARGVFELGPETTSPLRSDIIVATPAVRAQFGSLLNSVYAPAVIASFGTGSSRIDIRQIAPHGAAAYRTALGADLLNRKNSGAELLHSNRVTVSAAARKQLAAGQADSRLLISIAGMAAVRPVAIVVFGDSAPGASPRIPLRVAEVTEPGQGGQATGRSATSAFVRSMGAFLRAQHAPYLPLRFGTVRTAAGQTVLRVEFAAPSPLGLLGPHG
jgi:hypothetical protein